MAGEKKGKTYEALVKVALLELRRKGRLRGEVFWNQKPSGMTIEPDLTVGADADHPDMIFLVTHSGKAKNSDMKFWRNMGELAEAKTRLENTPLVYSIAFDSVIMEGLKRLQEAAFDGQVIVGDKGYGKQMQAWVDTNYALLPTDPSQKVEYILNVLEKRGEDPVLKRLMNGFVGDLGILIASSRSDLEKLWSIERKRKPGRVPEAKQTFVRRGLGKLQIFENVEPAIRLYRGGRVAPREIPQYAYDLRLAGRAIGRVTPSDPEIRSAVQLLADEQIHLILRSLDTSEMSGWLLTLRNTGHLKFMGEYVIAEYEKLCSPQELAFRLQMLHDDPRALVNPDAVPSNWPPQTVWLLEYLIELIKVSTGTSTGFGHAQLAREIADPEGPAKEQPKLIREILLSPWGHLSTWVHRDQRDRLDPRVIEAVAAVISTRLKRIELPVAQKIIRDIPAKIVENIIETKILTYHRFDPLFHLLSDAIGVHTLTRLRTCFAEAASLGGQAGSTQVIIVGKTLINWQSVSDAGRDHKKKELAGRAVALRYSWDKTLNRFIPRPGIKKLILVVDGTWRQADLETLARAGWDEIFYPDEIDKLIASLV